MLARVEREAILQNENCQIKFRTIEQESIGLKDEVFFYISTQHEFINVFLVL